MRLDWMHRTLRGIRRPVVATVTGLTMASAVAAAGVAADPADDALAKLNELSRQAEQTTEAMHSAQIDLDEKLADQRAAEEQHDKDLAAAEQARNQLAGYQRSVDGFAATMYMGGRTDGFDAIMTASSPQAVIDKLSVQQVMGTEMNTQMTQFRQAGVRASEAEQASAASAAEAKAAADEAAEVRSGLQAKARELQTQIAIVKAQYLALTPVQRTALADVGPPPEALPADPPPPEAVPGGPPDALLPGAGSGAGSVAVQAALTRVGSPYSWGGSGPGAFDCSGLVMWAFQQAGISLPHSSYALAAGGQPVSLSELQPGDVLSFYSDASHVGLYIGDGMIVHASTYGVPVAVVPMTASGPIYNARRY
ncbi:peptidoglycan hydrolase RipC [Mycolicibacillus parakoreensis]